MRSEAAIAADMIKHLEADQWDVYQEVKFKGMRGRADIVSRRGQYMACFEVKKHLNLEVISQAYHWSRYAHWSSVVVPHPRANWDVRDFSARACEAFGLGLYFVTREGDVREQIAPSLHRNGNRTAPSMLAQLCPEQKTFSAAGTSGAYWTEFKGTARRIVELVKKQGQISVKQLVTDHGKFHYKTPQSARHSIVHALSKGWIDGVTLKRDGRQLLVVPVE